MAIYGIQIDHESCWGCKACEVACKQEMKAPQDIKLIVVSEDWPVTPEGNQDFLFQVHMCRHCDEPPCVEACPEQAIVKRSDGIVLLDSVRCSGCQTCIEACPYGAISFDEAEGLARKCNLCHHRVEQGLIPACADNVCLAHCIHFGEG